MAKMVLKAAYLALDGTDLSSHTSSIEVTAEVEEQDVTTFGSSGWTEVLGGLASGQLAVTFKQDLTGLDAVVWPLFGDVVPFEVRLSNAAVSASNPAYTGEVLVSQWSPIAGAVGNVAEVDVTWPTSGPVTRATA